MRTKQCCLAASGLFLAVMAIASPAAAQPTGTMYVVENMVGIGTDTPKAKLHVVVGGTPYDLHPQTAMAFQNDAGAEDGVIFALLGGTGTTSNSQMVFGNSTNQFKGRLVYSFGGGPGERLRFWAAGAERAVLTGTGRFGIGTANPQATLDVNGSIYQRGGVVHADYVFEPDYDLPTIEEQAASMWKNKHLPAVGPGKYDEEGKSIIELGAHNAAMLEELEKAHIYIEQLHQRLRKLEEIVASGAVSSDNSG